jgi:hypothetical protein
MTTTPKKVAPTSHGNATPIRKSKGPPTDHMFLTGGVYTFRLVVKDKSLPELFAAQGVMVMEASWVRVRMRCFLDSNPLPLFEVT